jgi:16S rRNA (guanine527-N7)-methyltransferase
MNTPAIPDFVAPALEAINATLPEDCLARQGEYLDLLLEHNKQFNLTGIRDRDEAWRRHIIDSLTLLPGLLDLTAQSRVIDVGSGGGLPGIPLAIARPDVPFTLLEGTGKKAKFLQLVVDTMKLPNVKVIHGRAEEAGQEPAMRHQFTMVVCRAVGPMREILEYTLPFLVLGGRLLAMKGPTVEQELESAADAMEILGGGELEVIDAYPEGFDQNTVIVSLVKERPTPAEYPRRAGVPRNTPL